MKMTLLAMSLMLLACSHQNKNRAPASDVPQVEGTHYTAIEFEEGKTDLNEMSKNHLNSLAQKAARDGREIEEIIILAWADKEYPAKEEKASPSAIILAKERAQAVKDYFEEDLHSLEDIDSYNMAKRPHMMSKVFNNDDYTVKEAFEKSGTTGTRLPDGSTSYTKASKALVIIEYANQKM